MSMGISDQFKFMKAGFRIFRMDPIRKEIREAKSAGGWRVYATYSTKKAMTQDWNRLMDEDRNIAG